MHDSFQPQVVHHVSVLKVLVDNQSLLEQNHSLSLVERNVVSASTSSERTPKLDMVVQVVLQRYASRAPSL